MDRNDKLTLLIAGAAGLGIYFVVRKQQQAQAAGLIAGMPGYSPGFWETLLGKIPETVVGLLDKAKGLDQAMQARGPAHHAAWKKAVSSSTPYYHVGNQCFKTATGELVAQTYCPVFALESS